MRTWAVIKPFPKDRSGTALSFGHSENRAVSTETKPIKGCQSLPPLRVWKSGFDRFQTIIG